MIYIITHNYARRNGRRHNESGSHSKHSKPASHRSSRHLPSGQADNPTMSTPWNVASYLFAVSEDSPECRRNLQNIQNMMGDFNDLYDYCASYAHYTSWSCEACTSLALQLVIISGLATVAFICIVPLKQITLFSGVLIFFLNTRFAKSLLLIAYSNEWPTQIVTEMRNRYQQYSAKSASMDPDHYTSSVSVFENQRWYDGRGFTHEVTRYIADQNILLTVLAPSRCLQKTHGLHGQIYQGPYPWVSLPNKRSHRKTLNGRTTVDGK